MFEEIATGHSKTAEPSPQYIIYKLHALFRFLKMSGGGDKTFLLGRRGIVTFGVSLSFSHVVLYPYKLTGRDKALHPASNVLISQRLGFESR